MVTSDSTTDESSSEGPAIPSPSQSMLAVMGTAFPETMSVPATASSLSTCSRAGLSMRFGDRVEDRSASDPLALCCAADTVPSASGSGLCSSNESSQPGFRPDGLSSGRVDDYGCPSLSVL